MASKAASFGALAVILAAPFVAADPLLMHRRIAPRNLRAGEAVMFANGREVSNQIAFEGLNTYGASITCKHGPDAKPMFLADATGSNEVGNQRSSSFASCRGMLDLENGSVAATTVGLSTRWERPLASSRAHAGLVVVSDHHKAVFQLIPKCASSTLRKMLGQGDGRAYTTRWDNLSEEQRGYYKFAFMRDPISRAFSAYGEILRRNGSGDPQWANRRFNVAGMQNASTKTRFLAFLDEVVETMWDHHINLQVSFQKTKDGAPFPLDFIGRVDHLDADFAAGVRPYLSNAKDIPSTAPVCRPATVDADAVVACLISDPEVRAVIEKIYQSDVALWSQLPLQS